MPSTDKQKGKPTAPPVPPEGIFEREYGHSSGDRNTRTDEHDWKHFKDGKERTEHVDAPREPSSDPDRGE